MMKQDRSKIQGRARKLHAMAQRGTEHERATAQMILESMYERYDWLKPHIDVMSNPEIDRIFKDFVANWNAEQRSKLARNKGWDEL